MNPNIILFVRYILSPFAGLLGLFIPGYGRRPAWQEAQNKAAVMAAVNNVENLLTPDILNQPLTQLTALCYDTAAVPPLFAIEGLGFLYTNNLYQDGRPPTRLWTDAAQDSLPQASLTMLHAGMGLSYARYALSELKQNSSAEKFETKLEQFLALCRDSSRPGYSGCAIEILGIPAVILHGLKFSQTLAAHLEQLEPTAAEYLWRGIGRALYFYPPNFIPGLKNPWKGFKMAARLALHETARKNMAAGLAWACTLVNIRYPEIIESFLHFNAVREADRDALVNGVVSAVLMYHDIAPDNEDIRRFIAYQPASHPSRAAAWAEIIQRPCQQALAEIYPALKEKQALEQLFRFQPLTAVQDF